ncbi:MAG: hypothetical protein J0H53_22845 [Rhizobiales bacterium]|nr:hypothetical protein [Hyphomicrobiales bacterium]OJU37619.1 MAG: hypothetical protein BGN94_23120 [Rhizobiales bacterium 68-8]
MAATGSIERVEAAARRAGLPIDLDKAARLAGQPLERGDPRHIREETGFAIGGVSPIGYDRPLPVHGDENLLAFDVVWAAAGAHDAVFAADPAALFKAVRAR